MRDRDMAKTDLFGPDIFVKGFAVERQGPTYVRILDPMNAPKTIRVDSPHRLVRDVVEIAAPSEEADHESVQIELLTPSRLLRAARAKEPLIVEVRSGERVYHSRIPASMRALRFNFFYNESDPGLIECERHGTVRAQGGVCPYPPPHTALL
jgi:hypothetical protein